MSDSESLETFLETVARATWDLFRKDALLYVLACLVMFVVGTVSLGLCIGPLTVGFIELVRRRNQGQVANVGDVFSGFSKFGSSFLACLLVGIAFVVGSIVFVLPGMLVLLFATFVLHVIAFESASAIDAIKRSFELVRNSFVKVIVLLLCIAVLNAIGHAVIFGGLLTMPLALIALTVAYQRLSSPVLVSEVLSASAMQGI